MKKNVLKVISAFLSILLVVQIFSVLEVFAVSDTKTKTMTPLEKYRSETSQSLKKITDYIDQESAKAQSGRKKGFESVLKVSGYVGKAMNMGIAMFNAWDDGAEWYENVGNMALNLVTSYLGVQLPGQETSDAEIIIAEMEKMIDEVHVHLDEIQEDIKALSEQVEKNSADLAAYVTSLVDSTEYKTYINSFTEEFGSYIRFFDTSSNQQKGDDLYLAYEHLNDALGTKDPKKIKAAYDFLYLEAVKSEKLYGYITGQNRKNTDGKSLQTLLYEYAISTKDETSYSGNLEAYCIDFAQDLYYTYNFAQYALLLCYNYQIAFMLEEGTLTGASYSGTSFETSFEIPFKVISRKYNTIGGDREAVNKELARYISYVLNLGGSYIYESGANTGYKYLHDVKYRDVFLENTFGGSDDDQYSVKYGDLTKYYWVRTNNKVSNGDTLYLNLMPDMYEELFAEGQFTFESSNSSVAAVNNAGVVKVCGQSGEEFTITMYYSGKEMYSISFIVSDRKYSGGMGTDTCPYLICTPEDFMAMGLEANFNDWTEEDRFVLCNDIDMSGYTGYLPVGTNDQPFNASFDGAGYTIKNLSYENDSRYAGVFGNVGSKGLIYDLNIDNCIFSDNVDRKLHREAYAGAIAGLSAGTIRNCFVTNTDVTAFGYLYDDFKFCYAYAGGVVGKNTGTISMCSYSEGNVYSNSWIHYYEKGHDKDKDSDNKNYSMCGGIAGYSSGIIEDCYSGASTQLKSFAYSACSEHNKTRSPYIYVGAGGIVGYADGGEIRNVFSLASISSASYDRENTAKTGGSDTNNCCALTGSIIGYRDNEGSWNSFLLMMGKGKIILEHVQCDNAFVLSGTYGENYVVMYSEQIINNAENKIDYITVDSFKDESMVKALTAPRQYVDETGKTQSMVCWYLDDNGELALVTRYESTFVSTGHGTGLVDSDNKVVKNEYARGEKKAKYYNKNSLSWGSDVKYYDLSLIEYRIDTSKVGTTSIVQIIPNDKNASLYTKKEYPITVQEETLSSIYIYSLPYTRQYLVNEAFNSSGLSLVAVYDNGTSRLVDMNRCDYSVKTFTEAGEQLITVTYEDKQVDFSVTVSDTEHHYGDWQIVTPATCTDVGVKRAYCTSVGHSDFIESEIAVDPTNHYGQELVNGGTENRHSTYSCCNAVCSSEHEFERTTVIEDGIEYYHYACACGYEYSELTETARETAPQITFDNVQVRSGNTFTIDLTFKNMPEIKSILINDLYYNTDVFELVSGEWTVSGAVIADWDQENEIATLAYSANKDSNGKILTLTFRVKDDAQPGDYVIDFATAVRQKVASGGETAVELIVIPGVVTVSNVARGDVNGDDFVDSDDAIYLLRHTLMNDRYPINQDGDMNGDGFVDSDDAIYLLRYTLMPDRYPLASQRSQK